jgi:hypothetical protein
MKQTLIVAVAVLALMTAIGHAATATPIAPAGYFYDASGKLLRIPGPGMMYDANGNLVRKTTSCPVASSSSSVEGAKASVSFPTCTADGSNVGATTTTKPSTSSASSSSVQP